MLAVLVLSVGCALALFHTAWSFPFSTQVGGAGDADEYSWFLSWMPFALGHGLDPLVSTYVNFPRGVNLMWNTSIVLPSFLMSPVTVIWGAAFSYNILATAAPALCATFAYVAFRRWTGVLPALVGALIFGFSPYMVSQSVGHLAQTMIMSAPLLLIVLDRLLVVQSSKPWRDGLLLGLLAWAQLLTGEEILAMEAVTALVAVVVLWAINRHEAPRHLRYAIEGSGIAAGIFLVLSSPFLAVQYFGPYKLQDVHPSNVYVSDLLNFFVPTNITELFPKVASQISSHFTGNGSEQGAYIGIPLVLFIIGSVFLARRRKVTWVALAAGLGAAVLSLGPTLHVDGDITSLRMPDDVLQKLPLLSNMLPDRFASMMTLAEGLLVALGLEELMRLRKAKLLERSSEPRHLGQLGQLGQPSVLAAWALAAIGLAFLFPITDYPASASPLFSAFDTGMSCPAPATGAQPGSARSRVPVALVMPTINELALRWQAEANFCFAMPSDTGMTGSNPGDIGLQNVMLTAGTPGTAMPPMTPATRAAAASFIQSQDIVEIVVSPESPTVPVWTPQGQAELVVWVEWLTGQRPLQSHDPYISYIWKDLPPATDIASGRVGTVPGA